MTTVIFYKTKEGQYYGFEEQGHTGTARAVTMSSAQHSPA